MSRARRWTADEVIALAKRLHPEPLRVSWSWTTAKTMGGAVTGAVKMGALRRVRGAPGANWYTLAIEHVAGSVVVTS